MRRTTVMAAVLVGMVLTGCSGVDSNAVTTYDGSTCVYEGPAQFDFNSTVNFGFVNESDTTNMGFSAWKVPEGTTVEEIFEVGIFEVAGVSSEPVVGQNGFLGALFPPTIRGGTTLLTAQLENPGQHVLVCFDQDTEKDYAVTFTVSDS